VKRGVYKSLQAIVSRVVLARDDPVRPPSLGCTPVERSETLNQAQASSIVAT
jgi:hypothetical protein